MFDERWQYMFVLNNAIALSAWYVPSLLSLLGFGLDLYLPSFVFYLGLVAHVTSLLWVGRAMYQDSKETAQATAHATTD